MLVLFCLQALLQDVFISILRLDEHLRIKVADFGLARDVYSSEYYRMNDIKGVPIRWMSLESIREGTFSYKTDVVSCISTFCLS